jgi:hypothetical protein
MNAKDLFNKALTKANTLPEVIDTTTMRRQVMMSVVAEWLWQLDDILDRPETHMSILSMASEVMSMINEHLNKKG